MLKLLLVLIVFAAVTYLAVRAIERRGLMPDLPPLPKRQPPRRPVAPDDDEEFLRDLDRKRRNPEDPE